MDWNGIGNIVKDVVLSDAFKEMIASLALALLLLLMGKLKILTEKDIKIIEDGYVKGRTIPTISNKVHLPNAKIEKVIAAIEEEISAKSDSTPPDPLRKKVQRTARKALRGLIGL
jgi:hypothetical protein